MSQTTVYSIALEEVELAHLPLPARWWPGSTPAPLWNVTRSKPDQVCHFELHITTDQPPTNLKEGSTKMYICHICNLNVPLMCKLQHNNSKRHKTSLQIANIALDRITKDINIKNEHVAGSVDPGLYCGTCNEIITQHDRKQHEASTSHRTLQTQENMFTNLARLYCTGSTGTVDTSRPAGQDPDGGASGVVHTAAAPGATTNVGLQDTNKGTSCTNGVPSKTNTQQVKDRGPQSVEHKYKLKQYIEYVKNKFQEDFPLFQKCVVAESRVGTVALNGDIVDLELTSFVGYRGTGCSLCDMSQCDFNTHKYSKKHLKRLLVPFDNKSCMRNFSISGHCALCNEVIPLELYKLHQHYHLETWPAPANVPAGTHDAPNNSQRAQKVNIPPTNGATFNLKEYPGIAKCNQQHVTCNTCQTRIPNAEKNVIEHCNGKNHKQNALRCRPSAVDSQPTASSSTATPDPIDLSKQHGIIDSAAGNLFCTTCLLHIPNNEKCVKDHVQGRNHLKIIKKKLAAIKTEVLT